MAGPNKHRTVVIINLCNIVSWVLGELPPLARLQRINIPIKTAARPAGLGHCSLKPIFGPADIGPAAYAQHSPSTPLGR